MNYDPCTGSQQNHPVPNSTFSCSPVALKRWVAQLGSPDEHSAIQAAMALINCREAAVPHLINALVDDNVHIRRKSIWPLLNIGGDRAVEPLIAALRYDSDAKVRRYAASALGQIHDTRAINSLIAAFADPDERVCWDAAVALEKIGVRAIESLIMALFYGAEAVRLGAANALAWLRHVSAIESLTESALRDRDAVVRTRAVFALGWIGAPAAAEPLISALCDPDDEVRIQAAAALGWLRSARAVDPLISLLIDRNEHVAMTAIAALSEIGGTRAAQALAITGTYCSLASVREAARNALSKSGVHLPVARHEAYRQSASMSIWRTHRVKRLPRRCSGSRIPADDL